MTLSTISSIEPNLVLPLFGAKDQHLRRLREKFEVNITHRDGEIRISGDGQTQVAQATKAIEQLTGIVRRRGNLTPELFDQAIAQVTGEQLATPQGSIDVIQIGKEVRPRTKGQQRYVDAIHNHDLVFSIGPAGSGKTYLAVAKAVEALKHREIRKIVLVRPAVEAGESLGFLPGDMQAKINPYLRPLLDAIHEMIGYDHLQQLIAQDVIEVVPLAYMRGRTLNEAFIILDEAQNSTVSQMKMFLTRMGNDSKIVVSGDTTQIDLPPNTRSGLRDAINRLESIGGVAVVELSRSDIVRHKLVQEIVDAYSDHHQNEWSQSRGKHKDGSRNHESPRDDTDKNHRRNR